MFLGISGQTCAAHVAASGPLAVLAKRWIQHMTEPLAKELPVAGVA